MSGNKVFPNYKNFLDSVDYDKNEVNRYFDSLIKELESERETLLKDNDTEMSDFFNSEIELIRKNEITKEQSSIHYHASMEELHEAVENERKAIDERFNKERETLNMSIEIQERKRNLIEARCLQDYYEKKYSYEKSIDSIVSILDSEYQMYYDTILNARNTIISDNRFYSQSNKILSDINELHDFLIELRDQGDRTYGQMSPRTISTSSLKEFENDIKGDRSLIDSKYELIVKEIENDMSSLSLLKKELDGYIEESTRNYIEKRNSIKNTIKSFKGRRRILEERLESNIKESKREHDINKSKIAKDVSLSSMDSIKRALAIDFAINTNFHNEEKRIFQELDSSIESFETHMRDTYRDSIDSDFGKFRSFESSIEESARKIVDGIDRFNADSSSYNGEIDKLSSEFKRMELDKKIESLSIFKETITNLISLSKDLDITAFEVLTSQEIKLLKLLELEKKLLTIEDTISIKCLEYDYECDTIERTFVSAVLINEFRKDLELLEHDHEIDMKILEDKRERKERIIRLKRKIEFLRVDYTSAHIRLSNASEALDIMDRFAPSIEEKNLSICLLKSTRELLLSSIEKRAELSELLLKHFAEKDMEKGVHDGKVTYLNDILEIEKTQFDTAKRQIDEEAEKEIEKIYPRIIEKKKAAGKKLKNIKKASDDLRSRLTSFNSRQTAIFEYAESNIDDYIIEFIKSSFGKYNVAKDQTEFNQFLLSSASSMVSRINTQLEKAKTSPLDMDEMMAPLEKFQSSRKSRNSLKKFLISYSSFVMKKARISLNEMERLTDDDEKEALSDLIEKRNAELAEVARINTILESPFLFEIDAIKDDRDEKVKDARSSFENYKEYFKKSLEEEMASYKKKMDDLNDAIVDIDEELTTRQLSIPKNMDALYGDLNEKMEQTIASKRDSSRIWKERITEKQKTLSKEIDDFNTRFLYTEKALSDEIQSLPEKYAIESKEFFEKCRKEKIEYQENLKQILEMKRSKRNEFVRKLIDDKEEFKKTYQMERLRIIDEANIEKAEKILEFGKAYDNIKKTITNMDVDFSEPLIIFESETDVTLERLTSLSKTINNILSNDFLFEIEKADTELERHMTNAYETE